MDAPENLSKDLAIGDLADEGDEFTATVWSEADGLIPLMFWATGRTENEAFEVASELAEDLWGRKIKDPEDLAYQIEAMMGKAWPGRRGPFFGTEFGEGPDIEDIERRQRQKGMRHPGPHGWVPPGEDE